MVTGASTADVALVLVDARHGVVEQSRRHAFLASLLRIPHLVVCVNKMDLIDYDEKAFTAVKEEFRSFAMKLDISDLTLKEADTAKLKSIYKELELNTLYKSIIDEHEETKKIISTIK